MIVARWLLHDPELNESWSMPINPNQAGSPFAAKTLNHSSGTAAGIKRVRLKQAHSSPHEWTFSGVIRAQEHYLELLRWAEKEGVIRVSDHLGRTFEVIVQKFAPEDRQPTALVPWRYTYSMTVLVLRRVS